MADEKDAKKLSRRGRLNKARLAELKARMAVGTVLDVPFKQKEEAQGLGAEFEPESKKWFVPQGVDLAPFARWMPETQEFGSEADFVREAVRMSEVLGQPVDEAREFVRDTVRAAEERAALDARHRVQEQGGSGFDAIDAVREAVRQARHQYFAERQHLYAQSVQQPASDALGPRQSPTSREHSQLDDAALGRRYREMVQSIATSTTLRGAEVHATLELEQWLDGVHHDAWQKTGQAIDGDRAIGKLIRTGRGMEPGTLPSRAAAALNKLRDEAGLNTVAVDERSPAHDEGMATVADAAEAFALDEARRAGVSDAVAGAEQRTPDSNTVTFADVADATGIDDAMRRRGLTADAVSPAQDATRSTVSAAVANEPNVAPGQPANDKSMNVSAQPGPVDTQIKRARSDARNEPDAKNPVNDPARPELDTVSPQDLQRVGAVRASERAAAETLLREQRKAMPKTEDVAAGAPAASIDAGENQIDIDPASRKPIVKNDGYEIPTQVASRYMVKEGRFWKLDGMQATPDGEPTIKPHFEDVGSRLKTQQNDRGTVADMLAVAKAKNWDVIAVKGSETFRRNLWIEASLDGGIQVKNFKPKEADFALLEAAKRERAALTIKAGTSPEPIVNPKTDAAPKAATAPAAPETPARPASTDAPKAAQSQGAPAKPADVVSGELLEHGSARYQHQKDASYSYFVRYRDDAGAEQTVWGVDLKRAMEVSGANVGDAISLRNLGETPVTVQAPVRDEAGKVIGTEPKDAIRNAWEVTRTTPEPAPAEPKAPARESLTVAQMREQLSKAVEKMPARQRAEVLNRFDARMQAGTEVEARIARGELSRDAGAAEIDKRAAELHAAWTAPKAAPVASPSNTPQTEPSQARSTMPNVM